MRVEAVKADGADDMAAVRCADCHEHLAPHVRRGDLVLVCGVCGEYVRAVTVQARMNARSEAGLPRW